MATRALSETCTFYLRFQTKVVKLCHDPRNSWESSHLIVPPPPPPLPSLREECLQGYLADKKTPISPGPP